MGGAAQIAPRWLFPTPSGPTSINMRLGQFGQSSIAVSASRFDGEEKIRVRSSENAASGT